MPGSRDLSSRWRAPSTRAATRSSATSSPSACSGCRAGSRMDFTFSEEQQMMAAAFRELATEICPPSVLRAVFEARDQHSEERWSRLAELGLFGVRVPAEHGGMGLEDADVVLLAEEAGRAALPEPLIEQAALAAPALGELAGEPGVTALLPELASGRMRIAVAHPQNPGAPAARGDRHRPGRAPAQPRRQLQCRPVPRSRGAHAGAGGGLRQGAHAVR